MKPKPRALSWIEEQTGAEIPYEPSKPADSTKHLSVRLPANEAARLEQMAAARGVTLSQLVRNILTSAADEHTEITTLDAHDLVARLAADVTEVQRRLVG
jgi:predicted DNA-binding protein